MTHLEHSVSTSAVNPSQGRSTDLPRPFRPGFRFGKGERYEVSSMLGTGATAVVVLVEDSVRRRRAAAKLLRSCDGERPEEALFRARAEARTLKKIRHENIVKVYEVGHCDETAYVLLEHRDGIALDKLLEQGPLSLAFALDIATRVAGALAHAHAAGVLHLDVKPANVWVTRDGDVKLLDFGMDAEFDRARREAAAGSRLLFGTPAYMAPEQWRLMTPDARTDIWSLGTTLYEALTGELPFAKPGEHPILVCEAVASAGAPPTVSDRLNAPPALDDLLRCALANERAERFQTAGDFLRALKGVARDLAAASSGAENSRQSLLGLASAPRRRVRRSLAANWR
jgi:serine/threonine protein kinase